MKILLALPLLLLLGGALAEEPTATRTCTNGRCILCVNGDCSEARSEASGSSSMSCHIIDGVSTCTTCKDGECHTSSTRKREASGDFNSNDAPSNCNATTCWHCMGGGRCSHTGEIGVNPCCYYYPRPLGQVRSKRSNCNSTGCTYCKGNGPCSMTGEPGMRPCCKFYPFEDTRKKEPLHPANKTYPFCTMTGCWYCDSPNPRESNCEWRPKPTPIFDPASCNVTTCWHCMGRGKCSMTNEPGKKPCCYYYPRPLWGAANNDLKPNCNATGCWRCKGFDKCSMNGEHGLEPCCDFVVFNLLEASAKQTGPSCDTAKGDNGCIIIPQQPLTPAHKRYPFCIMTGCWYCDSPNPSGANCTWHPRGKREAQITYTASSDTCETLKGSDCNCDKVKEKCTRCGDDRFCLTFVNGELEARRKREVGEQSTTKNCVNGHCIVCIDGQCNEMRNRKREQNHSSSTTCRNGNCTKCVNGSCTHYQE